MSRSTTTDTPVFTLSLQSRRLAGVLLLSITAVEFGGYFMTKVDRGDVPATSFQESFYRAGHAHAGVLVIFGLLTCILADTVALEGVVGYLARHGVPIAAILMPAGFFLSALGTHTTQPNGWIVLLWLGAVSLASGVVCLGWGLLRGAFAAGSRS